MYVQKKVELNQNGMNRVGYFVYDSDTMNGNLAAGFSGGYVVKQKDGMYAVFKATDAFNYGSKIADFKTEKEAHAIAEDSTRKLLRTLFITTMEKARTSKRKRESLEFIAM